MKWTLIFTFLASPGHRFSPAFTQIAPLLLPLGPSCLNVLVGDNCELLDFMLFFSLFYNFNASYPTHTNIYWMKDCSPVGITDNHSVRSFSKLSTPRTTGAVQTTLFMI